MRKIITLIMSAVMVASLAGCEKIGGKIVDWCPVYVYLRVTDGHGADLLDPENPDNMIDGTTITFKGKTYEASREIEDLMYPALETKAYLARIYGLLLEKRKWAENGNAEGYCLVFGEIDGAADMDEDLVVTLPNGMTGTIHYHCSNHNERKIRCDRSWKLNGVKAEGNIFTFVVSN